MMAGRDMNLLITALLFDVGPSEATTTGDGEPPSSLAIGIFPMHHG